MGIHGAVFEEELEATIHGVGVLRSKDEGRSWSAFSWIARGNQPIIGAASDNTFSFEGQSLQELPDGRWLAMVSARNLRKDLLPQVLVRLWSEDQGRTWTRPELFAPGAWPTLALSGQNTYLRILQAESGAGGALRSRIRSDSRCTSDSPGSRRRFEDGRVEGWS